jgi:LPXTG-motif cell wall-anchored protein
MKKHLRTFIFGIAFVLIFCISNAQKVYAVDQLIFDEPVLNTPYAGQTEISGILTGYGVLPSGAKVPVETYQNAAWITINGKQYSPIKYGNQMFNYTINKIDADRFSFTFQLPDNIVLKEGDEISGFVIAGTIDNTQNYPQSSYKMSGTYITQPRVIPAVGADVTVHYVDEQGMPIANPKTIPATAIGDDYDATTPDYKLIINGYTLDDTQLPTNAIGKFTDTAQTVTYVYKTTPANTQAKEITVQYIDQNGTQIANPKTIPAAAIGDDYDATTPDYKLIINGYTLDDTQLPTNAIGKFTDTAQTVTYVYKTTSANKPVAAQAKEITVQYIDQNGKRIAKPKTIPAAAIGDNYDATTPDYKLIINGYTLDDTRLPANAVGKFTDKRQTVTYVYKATPENVPVNPKTQNVIIHYVDQEGKQIAKPKIISGRIGEAYDVTSTDYQLVLNGYTLDKKHMPKNIIGILTDTPQTVTYVYTKITANIPANTQTQTNEPVNNAHAESKNIDTNTSVKPIKTQTAAYKKMLPKTGETEQVTTIYWGTILLLMSVSLYYNKKSYAID